MGIFSALEKSSKAKFKKIKEEGCTVSVSIEIPAAEAQDETHNALLRIQQRARLPGFRPGKAPLEMVKKHFTGHAQEEIIDRLLRKYVPEASRELNLRPVSAPAVEDVAFEPEKPIRFSVRFEIAPQFSPKDYAKIAVSRRKYAVTEQALETRLNELRDANARLEKAAEDAVGQTHYAVIDYSGIQNGKPMPNVKGESELVDMSSEQSVDGLTTGLLGLKRGETKDIPVKIVGKDAILSVTVTEIKTKILPALDAEFAKDVGFETVDELKKKLAQVMEEEGQAKTEREVVEQIQDALLKANHFPLPPSIVEAQLEHRIERIKEQLGGPRAKLTDKQLEDLKAKIRPKAEDEVRIAYLLPAIAEKEKIVVSDEDLRAELDKNLASAESEDKKEEMRKLFEERKDSIQGMLRERKTMEFLKAKANYTEVAA